MAESMKSVTVRFDGTAFERMEKAVEKWNRDNPLQEITISDFIRVAVQTLCNEVEGVNRVKKHVVRCEYCRLPINANRKIAYYLDCSDGLHRGVCNACSSAE